MELRKLRDDGKKIDHPVAYHKDIADAVAGCLWNCANSTELMSASRVAKKILNPISYTPIQSQSMELMEFERLKQQYATGLFKGL